MKVSAALQLLSAVMSSGPSSKEYGSGDGDDAAAADQWLQMQMQNDVSNNHDVVTVRTDLDLGACLDVGTLEELSQTLYNDGDSCPSQTVWEQHDNDHHHHVVINTTSYGEGEEEEEEEDLTSSGDHAGIVPSSEVSIPIPFAGHATQMQSLASSTGSDVMNFAGLGGGNASQQQQQGLAMPDDNASYLTLQSMAAEAATTTVDFSQFSALGLTGAAAFRNSNSTTTATIISSPFTNNTTTTTTTVDLTSLERLMTMDVDTTTSQQSLPSLDNSNSLPSGGNFGNLPSSLWNVDLTTTTSSSSPSAGSSGGDFSLPSAGSAGSVGVKESLRSRLYSRSSVASSSQDNDHSAAFQPFQRLSTRSSSASSLTQSFDDDDDDSDSKTDLEKREKNRLAAQKCRNKKKDKAESLEKDVSRLQSRRERLKEEVQKLRDERETLEQIIDVHGMVCPKMRKTSNIS